MIDGTQLGMKLDRVTCFFNYLRAEVSSPNLIQRDKTMRMNWNQLNDFCFQLIALAFAQLQVVGFGSFFPRNFVVRQNY